MTAGTTLPGYVGDPQGALTVAPDQASRQPGAHQTAHRAPVNTSDDVTIPEGVYRPIAKPPASRGSLHFSRRVKRLTTTREIRIKTTHRRRKFLARGGVLAGFGLAMVVYPIMGNVVEYNGSVESVPGVVLGQSPTTGHALLGDGPSLIPTVIDLPSVDAQVQALAVASERSSASQYLPDCTLPTSFDGENGQLAGDQLCQVWGDNNYMRADAALALAELNAQFSATFGRNICIAEGYRSYAEQVRIKALRGWMAASPGTSMHGFGVAFDLCSGDDSGAPWDWLNVNAASYGFVNPDWAKYRKYEPWHWEYLPATDAMGVYGSSTWSEGAADGGDTAVAETTEVAPVEPVAEPIPVVTPAATPVPTPAP